MYSFGGVYMITTLIVVAAAATTTTTMAHLVKCLPCRSQGTPNPPSNHASPKVRRVGLKVVPVRVRTRTYMTATDLIVVVRCAGLLEKL